MIIQRLRNIGPGALIAAAFIGPGTVTVCTLAGANYGFTLLWAMLLSMIITMILQEMSARLGLVSGQNLAAVVRTSIQQPWARGCAIGLMLLAIVLGNAAYEAGNISGGVLGLSLIVGTDAWSVGNLEINYLSIALGLIAFTLLWIGKYQWIERALVLMVVLMSSSFVITAIITKPNVAQLLSGLFVPTWPENATLFVVALLGTTVVPYNLFLHSALVSQKWKDASSLSAARFDTFFSILLGGLVSLAIIITAASLKSENIQSAADLALGLQPLYGNNASYLMAIGLFAAGITSAITAPYAAAFVVQGCFPLSGKGRTLLFRFVWISILLTGIVLSSLDIRPVQLIWFAQIANGVLLPVATLFLLWAASQKQLMKAHVNSTMMKIVGGLIVLCTVFLGYKSVIKVWETWISI